MTPWNSCSTTKGFTAGILFLCYDLSVRNNNAAVSEPVLNNIDLKLTFLTLLKSTFTGPGMLSTENSFPPAGSDFIFITVFNADSK